MMKKQLRPLLALALMIVTGVPAMAADFDFEFPTGYGNESYASQISYDSFNRTVRQRMAAARTGSMDRYFGLAPAFASDGAYAMVPASRSGNVAGASSRRQLDCVYYNGFAVWADFYQSYARQRSHDDADGYRHRVMGPALGLDWSSQNFTVGLASTYNWGRLKSRDWHNTRSSRTWALELYAQYSADMFYVNATAGYGRNSYKSSRTAGSTTDGYGSAGDKYHSDSWNFDAEFGMKFNFGGFRLTPSVGLRYFHDRRDNIDEHSWSDLFRIQADDRNYHVLELPVGVNLAYEINAGGSVIIPQIHAAWIPELARKRGASSGTYFDGLGNTGRYDTDTARRNRHGFEVGAGVEAKITKSLSAHLNYNFRFRSKSYEHYWNLGLGFTF